MKYYHVLNRGVDKRSIFMDEKDYLRFIHDLYEFNDINNAENSYYINNKQSPESSDVRHRKIEHKRELLVKIHFFALMKNHYHLLLSPVVENGIALFIKKLNGGYAKYFNKRYERSGTLWQSKYKSVLINNERHFLFIPYYIHFNPLDIEHSEWRNRGLKNTAKAIEFLENYRWSSHRDYMGIKNFPSVTQREKFLEFFNGTAGYTKALKTELRNFSEEGFKDIILE